MDADLLVSICLVESFFRPLSLRVCEYFVVFWSCIVSLFLHTPVKNYTIGKCQLGLAIILSFYGGGQYHHSNVVFVNGFFEIRQIFSVFFLSKSIEILAFNISPISQRAGNIYPDKHSSKIRYIGEQFNGRYSYGLMLADVYKQIEKTN